MLVKNCRNLDNATIPAILFGNLAQSGFGQSVENDVQDDDLFTTLPFSKADLHLPF